MSELNSLYVKRGYWVNHSQGPIMGQTITTDTKTGAIMVALLAVCTALGMSHLWNLINFLWHQIRADGRPSEGLFRQQQALIRTLPTPGALLADSLKLIFVWRGKAESRALRHSLLSTLVALIFAIGSVAASIFSSYAVAGSNLEVLVSSPLCGRVEWDDVGDYHPTYWARAWTISEQYADDCYGDGTIIPTRCNMFVKPRIPFVVENASCPFSSTNICSSETVAIDTRMMDLNDAFGLNLDQNEHVKYRQRMTCAVLDQQHLTTVVDASVLPSHYRSWDPLPGEKILQYHLGPRPDGSNMTFGIDLLVYNLSSDLSHTILPYFPEILPDSTISGNMFDMIPGLRAVDAASYIHIIRKGGRIYYGTPVEDPVFSAHRQTVYLDMGNNYNRTVYYPDEPSTLMGCAAQFQFCASLQTGGEKCTELNTLPPNITESFPEASELQLALLRLTVENLFIFSSAALSNLEASALPSNGFETSSLPNDQWIRELKRWVSLSLVQFQTLLSDFAIGPAVRDADAAKYCDMPPTTEGERRLCTMQRMRKPGGFVNINVFALSFIITFSVIVILIDFVLLRFLIYLSKFRAALYPRIDRWIQDGIYQLQRRAYEDQISWQNLDQEIPVTARGVKLRDFPMTKPSSSSSATPPIGSTTPQASRVSVVASPPATPQTTGNPVRPSSYTCTGTTPATTATAQILSNSAPLSSDTGIASAAPNNDLSGQPLSNTSTGVLPPQHSINIDQHYQQYAQQYTNPTPSLPATHNPNDRASGATHVEYPRTLNP